MCGIAGFNWSDSDLMNEVLSLLAHRGPDGEGVFVDKKITLGHKRLAIIDLTDAAEEPMKNEDETICLTYNGEIYNYIELRDELKALHHTFSSATDAEVVIHAYEEWGEESLQKFNGMFAFCLYDKKSSKLFLARDRFGIKPLYFFNLNGKFIFSSEIKVILHCSNLIAEPNEDQILDYLLFNCYNHTEKTFFKNIYSLLPGHYLIVDLTSNNLQYKKWYNISITNNNISLEEGCEILKGLLVDSIKLRLRSDVEVGTCLSGGLDSSSIVCNLKNFPPKYSKNFKSFSIIFPNSSIDESPYIHDVIRETKVEPFFKTLSVQDLLTDLYKLIYHQEEPFGGTSIFAQWEVMKLAREHNIKVLLDGQGGDELLGGYPFFFGYYFNELFKKMKFFTLIKEVYSYRKFQKNIEGLVTPIFLLLPKNMKSLAMEHYFHCIVDRTFIKKNLKDSSIPSIMYSNVDLNKALYFRMMFSLPQLLREEDKNSMAFSIESRLPFLDYRLVEFLFSLPSQFKLKNGLSKYILREAMKGTLPESVRYRTLKLGFPTPLEEWLRNKEMTEVIKNIIFSPKTASRGYYNIDNVKKVFVKHMKKEINAHQTLWKILNLELWFSTFIDKA